MKSERRHELQTNELADWVGNYVEVCRPYLKTATAVVLAVAAIGLAYAIVSQRQEAAAGLSWEAYFKAVWQRDQKEAGTELQRLAEREKGTLPGLWALETEADLDLESGVQKLFRDRDEAMRDLDRAIEHYRAVEKQAAPYPELLARCRYGLAQALEAQGELSEARSKYEEVAKANANSALGKMAERRLKGIKGDHMADFYTWFAKQTPPPPGKPGGTGLPPLNLDDLPDRPDLSFGSGKDGEDSKKPATDVPAEEGDAEKPTDKPGDKPADKSEDKPADKPTDKPEDKPADKPSDKPSDKPADDAGEKPADKPAEKPAEKPAAEGKQPESKPDEAPKP